MKLKINLACGDSYVAGEGWRNLDFVSRNSDVEQCNLLGKLPIKSGSASLVYSSHFLEHIPKNRLLFFLTEIHRVLEPGGTLRIVTPDFENMCSTYLSNRDARRHDLADFEVMLIADQCVRTAPGGELGKLFEDLRRGVGNQELVDWVISRTGEELRGFKSQEGVNSSWQKLSNWRNWGRGAAKLYVQIITGLLPRSFREQNVSFTSIGENHQWLWDFHQLKGELTEVGFTEIERKSANRSNYPGFPCERLDLKADDSPRKGELSMYVESIKGG